MTELRSTLVNRAGQTLKTHYRDVESEADLAGIEISGVHAFCFCGDKLVIVYSEEKGYWTPPGGGVEAGESAEEAVVREVKEETNMRVCKQRPLGTLDVFEPTRVVHQLRAVCIVEPYGPFVADPDDGEVTEIRLIDPGDITQYFDWGEVGAHLLRRALEIKGLMASAQAV
jgi:ADP-ribose pyrophosphatase YjhB (NUDIX family)